MKINSSTINMESGRFYANSTQTQQATLMSNAGTGAANYSSTSFLFTYAEYSGSAAANPASRQYDSYMRSPDEPQSLRSDLYTNLQKNNVGIQDARSSLAKFRLELIKHLEEFMERVKNQLLGMGNRDSGPILDLTTGTEPGSLWTKKTYQRTTYMETEYTSFNSTGSVVTSDGRIIQFDVAMEMSHSFMETTETLTSETQYILTDPLVIKLDDAPDTISDQKWFFDIDRDGKKEEISQLAKGNGFLALDANNNGKIDDGSELFGTKSGNGFKDLAAYDEDGNGWIDENDSVYSKLKIWIKDAEGNDKLMDLRQADIGAIYLGAANTQFSHKSADTNETQAVVRQTGFYLHESTGAAGIVQQIDFATT